MQDPQVNNLHIVGITDGAKRENVSESWSIRKLPKSKRGNEWELREQQNIFTEANYNSIAQCQAKRQL